MFLQTPISPDKEEKAAFYRATPVLYCTSFLQAPVVSFETSQIPGTWKLFRRIEAVCLKEAHLDKTDTADPPGWP